LHVRGDEGLNYNLCLTNAEFGKQPSWPIWLYFKYYSWMHCGGPMINKKLIDDFEALSNYLTHTEYKYFMFRDFQSRNILVKEASPPQAEGLEGASIHFIDYQGGMKGAPQYDVASMLWQARANLPDEWKENLLVDYMNAFENLIGSPLKEIFFAASTMAMY
jgi:aminoglycoside/choline kinase family phosphotransferase